MRPRKFALPQAGTGGYGIRPYVFLQRQSPLAEAVPRVELSPFVESEIRRGAFYMRPRRFILPQAGTGGYGIRPYVFCGGRCPAQRRCPAWSCLPLLKARSVGAHSICARGSLSYRKRARADMESAPTFLKRRPRGAFLPVVRASGFISACALSKTILCGILFLYKSTGKPGANRRRKAIGAHRVSQLPTRNCCFTAAGSFASFLGQELTRVKTHRYTGGTKQGIYNALLFSAARGYCLIRPDSAFRYGSAMP